MTTTRSGSTPDAGAPRRHAPVRRWLPLVAVALLLAAVGVGARMLADYQWDRVVEYESPYVFDLERGEPTPRLVDHVVLVVVDGLGLEPARDLPVLSALGEEGSFLVARTSQPSLSLPGWTYLTSGAPPEISGVTTNWYEGRVGVDSILDEAKAEDLTTAVVGSRGWRQLYGDVIDTSRFVGDDVAEADPRLAERAIEILGEDAPDLLIVHLPDVDHRGHESGVGRAYREAAARADELIGEIAGAMPSGTALIVTADHGHIATGGHGGPEREVTRVPLVLSGEGLVPGARGEVALGDVAPTIAALLGLPRPAHAVSELRPALLDADEETRDQIEEAHEDVERRFYAQATGVVHGSGETETAFERARQARLRHDVFARLPIALGIIAVFALAVAFFSRGLDAVAVGTGVVVFLAGWSGLFFLGRGLTFSFSHFNTEDQVESFLLARLIDTVLVLLVVSILVGLIVGRRQVAGAYASALGTSAWILLLLGLGVATFLTIFGWAWNWRLPELSAGFAEFLGLLVMFAVGVAAWLIGLVSLGVARLVAPRDREPAPVMPGSGG